MDPDKPIGHEGATSVPYEDRRNIQVDNAIRAITEKKPVPEIDFTIHALEDGTSVNTMERVCKGNCRAHRLWTSALACISMSYTQLC